VLHAILALVFRRKSHKKTRFGHRHLGLLQTYRLSGAKAPDRAAPAARRRRDNHCACRDVCSAPPSTLGIWGTAQVGSALGLATCRKRKCCRAARARPCQAHHPMRAATERSEARFRCFSTGKREVAHQQ